MQTPNPGSSKNTINAATVDLSRRVPHSDGKVREKYELGPAKGRCGIATTTPMNLNAPFFPFWETTPRNASHCIEEPGRATTTTRPPLEPNVIRDTGRPVLGGNNN
jgi:hypothetical protein